jgi:thiamine-phosphate pyrophosphorylase
MTLPRFYPIFDDVVWLRHMLPLGIKLVQMRLKDKSQDDLRAQLTEARDLCAAHDAVLVVNDHWKLAIDLGCDWVHLGQEDLDDADVDAIRAAGLKLGISTHDKAELARALALAPDYIALGPIYPTILKKMKWHQQGVEKLSVWKDLVGDIPLIAIGGMSTKRAPGAFAAGADIVSAVTDITLHDDPEGRVKAWLEACA